jgi:hypothetical protein
MSTAPPVHAPASRSGTRSPVTGGGLVCALTVRGHVGATCDNPLPDAVSQRLRAVAPLAPRPRQALHASNRWPPFVHSRALAPG